jgi:hypothetical protein
VKQDFVCSLLGCHTADGIAEPLFSIIYHYYTLKRRQMQVFYLHFLFLYILRDEKQKRPPKKAVKIF